MTSEEYDKLTDEEKRIKIARLHGYYKQIVDHGEGHTPYAAWFKDGLGHHSRHDSQLPNYLNDLNAMHEAVMSLSELDRARFWLNVARVILVGYVDRRVAQCHFEEIAEATARQRAEAFVLTMQGRAEARTPVAARATESCAMRKAYG